MPASSGRWWLTSDSQQIVINADPERIYGLISDLPRMGEWSPECERVEWTGGSTTAAAGARFTGYNRGGPFRLMRWSRRGRVLAADPGREFAFVTEEGGRESTVWRYRFEPVAGGTRVTESYQVRWIPAWARIIDVPTNRHRELRQAMSHTLRRLRDAAETPARAPGQPGTAEDAVIAAAAGTGRTARRPGSPEKEDTR
jgi:Polyketide cyclase / dehydrase and lipid transport